MEGTTQNAGTHFARSGSFPIAYTIYLTPCISNRKPGILDSLLSHLESITTRILIANFEPNFEAVFGTVQIEKNAEKFPKHTEGA
jgi:hypothetical protein